jgi:hypothetical protein
MPPEQLISGPVLHLLNDKVVRAAAWKRGGVAFDQAGAYPSQVLCDLENFFGSRPAAASSTSQTSSPSFGAMRWAGS